jgi:hypothetical protein
MALYNWNVYNINWVWSQTWHSQYRNSDQIYGDYSTAYQLSNGQTISSTIYTFNFSQPLTTESKHGFTSYGVIL